MIDAHPTLVVDPLEVDAQHLADAFGDADPVFSEVVLRAVRLYCLIQPRSLAAVNRGTWAVACLADALGPGVS